MPKHTKSSKNPTQHDRFVETARALGCDEDKERFEAKLDEIVRHKPEKDESDSESKPEKIGSELTVRRKRAHISKKNMVP